MKITLTPGPHRDEPGRNPRPATGPLRLLKGRCIVAYGMMAGRPVAATGLLILVSVISILAITAAAGIPEPKIHDELSQWLMADNFANGRLCGEPHPFWHHFETFHVLWQPCYQGKYPPGLPLMMAFGQVLTGQPILGVWISVVAMIAATAYAMYGWLPSDWALLGTALVTLRFGLVGGWAHGYMGGPLAAAGGALVFGAFGRLNGRPEVRDGTLFGVGLVLLAMSRPYEGLAYSLPALAVLAWRLCQPGPVRRRLWRAGLPAVIIVSVAGFGWLAYYNWRVTGSPTTLPITAYERAYSAAPLFVWQEPRSPGPVLRHLEMRRFEREFALASTLHARSLWPRLKLLELVVIIWYDLTIPPRADVFWLNSVRDVSSMLGGFRPTLLFAGIGLLFARRTFRAPLTMAAASIAMVLLASLFATWSAPQYLAPATVPLFVLVTVGLAGLSQRNFNTLPGWTVSAVIVLPFVASVPLAAIQHVTEARKVWDWSAAKRDIRAQLLQTEGDDVVFVRYEAWHTPHDEWVYNGAEIDRQPIVWAREIDPESDARLRTYFRQRKAWVVLADTTPPRLVEWPAPR